MNALIFSDFHFHIWKSHNKNNIRTKLQLEMFEFLLKQAHTYRVPIIFGGDVFHTPGGLSNSLFNLVVPKLVELFRKYPVDFYAISGNHDVEGLNSYSKRSPSYITGLANTIERFHVIDFETVVVGDMALHGVPYINFNQDYPDVIDGIKVVEGKFNILVNHCDYKGQKDTNGIVIGRGENITRDMFKKFDLTLSGHVHKPGLLFGNVYSIGSVTQQRSSDMDGEFGYWTLKKGFKLKHHLLEGPEFRFYEDPKEIDNDYDFWIKKPKENVLPSGSDVEVDTSDGRFEVLDKYLQSIGNKSRSKRRLLISLLDSVENDNI